MSKVDSILATLYVYVSTATCPYTPIVENWDGDWDTRDAKIYQSVIENERCKAHFGDGAPCLSRFIKKGVGNYYAICTSGQAPRIRSSGPRNNPWFAVTVLKNKEQRDYIP